MKLDLNANTIVSLVFYPILILFIALFIYSSIKTYKTYKKRDSVENQVVILSDEINGSSSEIISDIKLPLPMIGNQYSMTFNLRIDSNYDKTKEYTIFSRGSFDEPDLKLVILPYSQSNSNSLRFFFKINDSDDSNESIYHKQLIHSHEHNHGVNHNNHNDNSNSSNNSGNDNNAGNDTNTSNDSNTGNDANSSNDANAGNDENAGNENDGFKNTNLNLKTQTNTVNFSKNYKESFFNNINSVNTDNFISTNYSIEKFDEHNGNENENGNENGNENNEELLQNSLEETIKSYKVLTQKLNEKIIDYETKSSDCNGLEKVEKYDYCDLINNNLDTHFHIGLTIYNNIIDIYKNGDLVSSCVLKGEPIPSLSPFVFFTDGGFNGTIGNFNFFNVTLKTEHIKTIYQRDVNNKISRNIVELNIN